MNKSKFLKKSLAAILSVLLIVAMIPLSAAAANDYKPVGLKIVGPAGETVTGAGQALTLNLNYTATPKVTISTGTPSDQFVIIREKVDSLGQVGSEDERVTDNPATLDLQVDADKKPVQFRFYVVNGSSRTEDYTIDWTVATAATTGSATKAVMADEFEGEINEANKTITFTVPFGYDGAKSYYVDFDGCTTSRIDVTNFEATGGATPTGGTGTATGNGVVGTHQIKPVGQLLTAETQDGKTDVQYTVYVNEEAGLTEFKVGDLVTEFALSDGTTGNDIDSTDGDADFTADAGMQSGVIKVFVPSTLEPVDGKVKLTPTYKISDPNTNATIQTYDTTADAATDTDVVSGKEFDFSYAYGYDTVNEKADATKNNPTGVNLILTSTNGDSRIYKLVFVRWEDTALTSVQAVDYNGGASARWSTVDGTIDGDNIEIIVPKTAALNSVTLTFTGPRNFGTSASTGFYTNASTANIDIKNIDHAQGASLVGGVKAFTNTGEQTAFDNALNYTKPVAVVVTSDDGMHQKVYTLTIKPIEEDTVVPQITSGVLVLKKGSSDEAKYDAVITQGDEPTVTFTVPHNTKTSDLTAADAVFTWARSHKATTVKDDTSHGFAGGDYVLITAATGNAVRYKIEYKRAAARTGKGISDFVLTSASNTNVNLAPYNNNRNYNVTANNNKFTVTVPDATTTGALKMNFKLDDGAKMYRWVKGASTSPLTSTKVGLVEIKPVNSTGAYQSSVDTSLTKETTAATAATYFIADEELATKIENGDEDLKDPVSGQIDMDIINNKYSSHKVDYTWNVKVEKSNLTRLSSFTDVQGNVKAEITSTKKGVHVIELTVPHSYVGANQATAKEFFVDFTVSPGATLGAVAGTVTLSSATKNEVTSIFDSGRKDYTTKIANMDSGWTSNQNELNPSFKVVGSNGTYTVQVGGKSDDGTDWRFPLIDPATTGDGTNAHLVVMAEDETTIEPYKVVVKKAAAKSGAQVTELTVNGSQATIDHNAKTITANVPFGTNLGQIQIALKASDMSRVGMGKQSITDNAVTSAKVPQYNTANDTTIANTTFFDKEVAATYDLRTPLKITVRSESDLPQVINTYTLTVKTGEQFSDVPADAWFAPYVKEAFDKGIVQGIGNGQFGPYTNITREDFVVMTGRMLNVKVDEDADVPFTDADQVGSWAKAYVAYFATNGVIGGVGDGSFKPKANITRQEAAKILSEALALEVTGTPTFTDKSSIASWALPYVAACQKAGIFNGDENGNFFATKMITRAETAKVMVDSLKIKK